MLGVHGCCGGGLGGCKGRLLEEGGMRLGERVHTTITNFVCIDTKFTLLYRYILFSNLDRQTNGKKTFRIYFHNERNVH